MVKHTQAVVLAAGRSSRFKTKKSKLVHTICGLPMISYPLRALDACGVASTLVTGPTNGEALKAAVSDIQNISFATQHKPRGTADAVNSSRSLWTADNILIINGDMPLISAEILQQLVEKHRATDAALSFVTTHVEDPTGYGRVLKQEASLSIVEEKDATEEQRKITMVNAGIYVVKRSFLEATLQTLSKSSATQEYYLTDLVAVASGRSLVVSTINVPYDFVRGVNTLCELWQVEQIKRCQLIKHWMSQGVRFVLPQSVHLDHDVTIGAGTVVHAGAYVTRGTSIGENCVIEPFSCLSNTVVGDNVTVYSHSSVYDSTLKTDTHVGPFARLRDGVTLDAKSVVGNFVEVKKSHLGAGVKAKHLAYLGDTTVGRNTNIGAGTITCNHDSAQKHQTVIEADAYIGSNTTLVAPVTVGAGAFTAAGSVVTKSVEPDDLAIARARQENKSGYGRVIRERNRQRAKHLQAHKINEQQRA